MIEKKTCYLVGFLKSREYLQPDECPVGNYVTNWAPDKSSESWIICELEVDVDIPSDGVLQSQAVQALQRVRARELTKSLATITDIDAQISTLTAIEHKES
jgi:hypothetical protein